MRQLKPPFAKGHAFPVPDWPLPVEPTPPRRISRMRAQHAWDGMAEMELLRHLGRTDFWTFFMHVFGAHANPKGSVWIDPEVHEPMARWFQQHVDEWMEKRREGRGEQKHLAVLVHREVGKTTMFTQAGLSWLQARDPELSIYIGSERTELSMKMLAGIKAVLDGSDPYSLFTQLYGNWMTGARTWTGKEIVHAARRNTARKDPSFGTYAVETSIVGAHPDVLCLDDPNSYERMISDTNWFAAVNSQVTSMFPVIQADGLILWPGTRYGDLDHFGVAFQDEGIASISGMQCEALTATPDGKWHVYFLAGRDRQGAPTTPKVWPEKRLKDFQRRDPLRYAAQVMNDPSISELNPLTREQCMSPSCWVDSADVPWAVMRFALLCDTAFWDGSKLAGKDETVYVVVGYPRDGSGDVYVLECNYSNVWRGEDLAKRLVSKVQQYRSQGRRIFAITDEPTMSGKKGVWEPLLKNYFHDANEPMPPFYEFDRHSSPKASHTLGGPTGRLVAAANFIVDGHVKFVKGGPGLMGLIDQLVKIGQYMVNKKIKIDRADAFSDAFQPELYQGMRRHEPRPGGYGRGASPIDGSFAGDWDDDESRTWREQTPREPLR